MDTVRRGMIAGEASVWAQPDGPNTRPLYLGCHEVGDLADPGGDLNLAYCPDPARMRGYRVSASWQGAPGVPTTSIVTMVGPTADYLEHWPRPGNLIINKGGTGRRDQFTNRERAWVLYRAYRTGRTYQNLASRSPDSENESLLDLGFAMERVLYIYGLAVGRQAVAAPEDLTAIAFLDALGVAAGTAAVDAAAPVYLSRDGGPWEPTAAQPFDVGEDIVALAVVSVAPNVPRILAARASDALAPPAIAYSDDAGATWTPVALGDADGDAVAGPNALFAIDQYAIWAATTGGYVFFSGDGGGTWTAQEEGAITAASIRALGFLSPQVGLFGGEGGALALTRDGGATWTPLAGPAEQAGNAVADVALTGLEDLWAAYADGALYYSRDGGATWAARAFPGAGAGTITALRWVSPMVGWMVFEPTDVAMRGVQLLRTIDGGYTWEPTAMPTTAGGVTGLVALDENTCYLAGAVEGATAFLGKVFAR